MDYPSLIERLSGYNPPDRTIDEQRQIAVDILDARLALESLTARLAAAEKVCEATLEWAALTPDAHANGVLFEIVAEWDRGRAS